MFNSMGKACSSLVRGQCSVAVRLKLAVGHIKGIVTDTSLDKQHSTTVTSALSLLLGHDHAELSPLV